MRELKFRVWHIAMDKFLEKTFIVNGGNVIVFGEFIELKNGCVIYPKDQVCVQQYTGLKDKNGVEIYEGDLINYTCLAGEHDYQKEINQEVFFEDGMFLFGRNDLFCMADSNFLKQSIEVVGNIFENKELIK